MRNQRILTKLLPKWTLDLRRRTAWMALVSLGMLAALATPFFLGRVYTNDDLGEFHLPLRAFYAAQLAAGAAFDWMPSLYCGFFVTGEGQLGGYHPVHWLLYRCLPLGAAFDWELLLSYPCLLAGTYLLFRRLTRRRDAALFGAMTFTFSGFCLLHFVHPNAIAVVAHTPWLLWAIDVAIRPRSPREHTLALAAIALLTGSQCLAGYPQYVWLSLLVEIGFTVWRLIGFLPRAACKTQTERPDSEDSVYSHEVELATPPHHQLPDDCYGDPRLGLANGAPQQRAARMWAALHVAATIMLAKACGALIGAQQLAPTIAALEDSIRSTSDVSFANYGSLHPLNLIQFIAPYLFRTRVIGQNTHELGLYCGAVPLLLCVWLWRERSDWGRVAPLARAGFALIVFGLVLAMGEHAGLYELQRWIPGVNHFRFPCRAIVMVHLAIALLTAAAFSRLTWKAHTRSLNMPRLRGSLSGASAVACGVAVAGLLAWPEHVANLWLVAAGPALVIVAAALLSLVAHAHRWAWYALPVFAALDLGLYGFSAGAYRGATDLNAYIASSAEPPTRDGRVVSGRDNQNRRHGDRLLLAGFARADGYAGLEPARRLDYSAPNVQRVAGVAFQRVSAAADAPPEWQAAPRPLDRARLLTRLAVGKVPPTLADLDVDRLAVVERKLELDRSSPGKATMVTDAPGHIIVRTSATGRQLLTINEAFDVGWEGTIDGRPAPIVRVNGDFMGVVAPRGQHSVELRFSPPSVQMGWLGSALGLGLLVIAMCAAAATGQMAGRPARRIRPARTPRRDELELATIGASANDQASPYFDDNPFVRIPQL